MPQSSEMSRAGPGGTPQSTGGRPRRSCTAVQPNYVDEVVDICPQRSSAGVRSRRTRNIADRPSSPGFLPTSRISRRNHNLVPREHGGGPDPQQTHSTPAVNALQTAGVPTATSATELSHEQAGTVKAGGCQASEINTDSIALKDSQTRHGELPLISPVSQPVFAAAAAAGASLAAEASSAPLMRNSSEAAAAAASQQHPQQHLNLHRRSGARCGRSFSVPPPLVDMENMSSQQRQSRLTAAVRSCSGIGADGNVSALDGAFAAATPGEVSVPDQTAAGSAPARSPSPSHPTTPGTTGSQDSDNTIRKQSPLPSRLLQHKGKNFKKDKKCRRKKDEKNKRASAQTTGSLSLHSAAAAPLAAGKAAGNRPAGAADSQEDECDAVAGKTSLRVMLGQKSPKRIHVPGAIPPNTRFKPLHKTCTWPKR